MIGKRSSYEVTCMVCGATFGNAMQHECPFEGVQHANKHRALEERVAKLEALVGQLLGEP